MRRRDFVGACAAGLLASGSLSAFAAHPTRAFGASPVAADDSPFPISVMLWTVYKDLLFEARLEKVAEAGYHAVELVDEFKNWSPGDYAAASRAAR